jgi:hypothetical protein
LLEDESLELDLLDSELELLELFDWLDSLEEVE